jgi:O-antigen ligase
MKSDWVERIGYMALIGFVSALQFSIAAANILLGLALLMWLVRVVSARRIEVPAFFYPLAAYATLTLVSAALSDDPNASFVDSKQLVLFLVVPMVYEFARGTRAPFVVQAIITVGAVSALFGIFQFGVLQYDNLGRRPQGALGHYMTYSGVLMLVTAAAASRILFTKDRLWPSLMMPALLVILGLTFTRSALVGACAGIAFLLLLKDLRLMAVMPVLAALFFVLAPPQVTNRFMSMFDARDPTRADRVTMLKVGTRMVEANPLAGVGPARVGDRYRDFLDPSEPDHVNPHLHNVPMQIAAERGLPALAAWLWMIVVLVIDMVKRLKIPAFAEATAGLATARLDKASGGGPDTRFLAATGLGCIVAMLGAGMAEYNFGDSEFLMLFLVLMTLPYAANAGTEEAKKGSGGGLGG